MNKIDIIKSNRVKIVRYKIVETQFPGTRPVTVQENLKFDEALLLAEKYDHESDCYTMYEVKRML